MNEILLSATTWMDLEGILLSKISQRKTNTVRYHSLMESEKYNKLVNITKRNRFIDIENKSVVTSGERERGRGKTGVGDYMIQTIMYEMSYTDILYNTGNIANIL